MTVYNIDYCRDYSHFTIRPEGRSTVAMKRVRRTTDDHEWSKLKNKFKRRTVENIVKNCSKQPVKHLKCTRRVQFVVIT